jgi:hypothetical protein
MEIHPPIYAIRIRQQRAQAAGILPNRTLPTNPHDQDPAAGYRNPHSAESSLSRQYENIPLPPSRPDSSFIDEMVSRFDDTEDEPINDTPESGIGRASNLVDTRIGHEDVRSNTLTSAKKHNRTFLGMDCMSTGFSSLAAKLGVAGMKKRSVRRGKRAARPTISRPQVSDAHINPSVNANADPAAPRHSRADALRARLNAIGEAQYLQTRRPLTPPSTGTDGEVSPGDSATAVADADAVTEPSRMRSLP